MKIMIFLETLTNSNQKKTQRQSGENEKCNERLHKLIINAIDEKKTICCR
jgi:hypothetical protein